MRGIEIWFHDTIASGESAVDSNVVGGGGLFLEQSVVCFTWDRWTANSSTRFMSVSLSRAEGTTTTTQRPAFLQDSNKPNFGGPQHSVSSEDEATSFPVVDQFQLNNNKKKKLSGGASAFNTTKHLWAGAVSAMVSRSSFICIFSLRLPFSLFLLLITPTSLV